MTQFSWEEHPRVRGSELREEIVDSMARSLYVEDWARRMEEKGRTKGWAGQDLMNIAPKTSAKARASARKLAREIERMNSYPLDLAYERAVKLPGRHLRKPTAEDFGYCLAMQALGTGVRWSDDHPDHGLKLPWWEFSP